MGFWGVVNNCIKNSDLILLLIDARVPEESMNEEVIKKAEKLEKEIALVFNKSDLISKEAFTKLRKEYKKAFFVSAQKPRTIYKVKKFLEEKSQNTKQSLRVSLIGYPNVGKSSIINILAPEAKAKVSTISGTTKKTQWIKSGNIRFMDTPGVIPNTDSKVQVGITASKDPHKIPNPDKVAFKIIKTVRKKDETILEAFYNIKDIKGESDYDVFEAIGAQKKYLIKGGEIDEHRTAIKIIEDWQHGRLGLKK